MLKFEKCSLALDYYHIVPTGPLGFTFIQNQNLYILHGASSFPQNILQIIKSSELQITTTA